MMKKALILAVLAVAVLSCIGIVSAATTLDVWLVDWTEDTQKLFEEQLIPEWNAIVNIKVIHWPSKTDPLALV